MGELIKKYLDEKNSALFESLTVKHRITLTKCPPKPDEQTNIWYLSSQPEQFSVGYYEDIDSTAPFTHELLHIDLIDKGFANFSEILPCIKDGVKNFIFQPIIGHVNNIFAHEKFYQAFLDMGYRPEEFVQDFSADFNVQQTIAQIDDSFDIPMLPNEGIMFFITSFFTAKDNRNPDKNKDLNVLLKYLREKDHALYQILDNTWTSWANSKSLDNKAFLEHLFDQTENWYIQRKKNIKTDV